MNRIVGLGVAFLLTAGVAIAADTHESLLKELLTTVKDATSALKTVKDEMTAKEAQPKVAKIGTQMLDVKKRMEKLGKPTPTEQEELLKKYKSDMEAAFKPFSEELLRVVKVPGGEDVVKVFKNLQ